MGVPAGGEEMRSIKSAMALYFILLAICVAGLIASLAKAQELSVDMWVSGTLSLAILIWSIFTWRDVLPPLARFPRLGWSAAGVAMGLATFAVAIGVIRGLQKLLHLPDEAMSSPYLSAGYGWLTVVAMVAVQPAIFEELAFRGAVLGALLRPLRPAEAVLVGAMMFMILHLAPMRFPHTFAMGVAAGFLRVRSGSLYPCIILHFTHNGLCVLSEWAKV
jgi:membrane protease YdiL (CAAX protease family)